MATTTNDYIFANILRKASAVGIGLDRNKKAREWLRNKAGEVRTVNRDRLFDGARKTNTLVPGKMYMYVYDAKTKETLPYWDAFPLIFCTTLNQDGHDGINLHYLPPMLRAKLMDALYTTINNNNYDETTKIRINYNILKQASNMRFFKPCYKKYLNSHIRSPIIEVHPTEWDIAIFLPTQNFQKASDQEVWRDSESFEMYKIRNKKGRSKFKTRFK